jgi:hypothetical protein
MNRNNHDEDIDPDYVSMMRETMEQWYSIAKIPVEGYRVVLDGLTLPALSTKAVAELGYFIIRI